MEEQLAIIIAPLTEAVEMIMNSTVSAADRAKAHQICEEFKETSAYIVQCGLVMAETDRSPIVRHFGLQLLEHCVKFRWNKCSDEEKNTLKTKSYILLSKGTQPILEEESHIKDAVSRIVVEIIKHEWPNNWPTLIDDLYTVCQEGATQTELVMKILLRLAEDVLIFQNLQAQRRREIMAGLMRQMDKIFQLFLTLLQAHSQPECLVKSEGNIETVQTHTRVSESVLLAMSGYLDWVNIGHLVCQDSLLLQMLCLLLSHEAIQLACAECLLMIVGRKGKPEERKPLMILFSEDAMSTILNAAIIAERASSDDHFYLFLKRLCQVVIELGKQLCTLWGAVEGVGQPPNFRMYLDAVLAFTRHPSQMLSNLSQGLWTMLLRHEHVPKDPVFLEFIPKIITATATSLRRVGYPSQHNSLSCDYARLDYDDDIEYTSFFSRFRTESISTLRLLTTLDHKQTFKFASDWVAEIVTKPIDTGGEADGICKSTSPSYLEWESLSAFLDSIMLKIPEPAMVEGVPLLTAVINFQTQDPMILSCLLSCLSALFVCIKGASEIFPNVLQKIFYCVVFEQPDQTKGTRSKAVRNVRQHGCSCLTHICKLHPALFFPVFDQLYNHIKVMESNREQLSQMEKCILYEALILVSNEYRNFEKQSQFIAEVLKPVQDIWLSDELTNAVSSPYKFMTFIGLDQAPVEPSSADTCGINRYNITLCINMILGVLKRSTCPADPQVAADGGFVIGRRENGDAILRHPTASHTMVLLPNLLHLLRMHNMLWSAECMKSRHAEFSRTMDLSEPEKLNVLSIPPPLTDQTTTLDAKKPAARMQYFLTSSHELGCHVLGNAAHCLGQEFYGMPLLAESIIRDVLCNLDNMPDYRMRPIVRVLLKTHVQHCPKQYYTTAVLPVLAHVCPLMFQRLGVKWEEINKKCIARNHIEDPDEDPMCQEVLDEQLARLLTRDYFDFIILVCKMKEQSVDKMMEESEEGIDVIGDLAKLCLADESIYPSLVMCVVSGLTWSDTTTTNKCLNLYMPLLKQLLAEKKLTTESAVHFYCGILTGLQVNGQHEALQNQLISLGVQTYEMLLPLFPDVHNLMLQVPSCTEKLLQSFEANLNYDKPHEKMKKKKDMYKKMVFEIIGKTVGEQFRRQVQYKSLPPLFHNKRRPVPPSLDESNTELGLCNLFQPDGVENGDT